MNWQATYPRLIAKEFDFNFRWNQQSCCARSERARHTPTAFWHAGGNLECVDAKEGWGLGGNSVQVLYVSDTWSLQLNRAEPTERVWLSLIKQPSSTFALSSHVRGRLHSQAQTRCSHDSEAACIHTVVSELTCTQGTRCLGLEELIPNAWLARRLGSFVRPWTRSQRQQWQLSGDSGGGTKRCTCPPHRAQVKCDHIQAKRLAFKGVCSHTTVCFLGVPHALKFTWVSFHILITIG